MAFFSRNNLSRIRDKAYLVNLDDKKGKGTHWVSLFIDKIQLYLLILLGLNIFLKKY